VVVQEFSLKTVFLDTAPLIYFIEGHSEHQGVLARLFQLNDNGEFAFITTSVTLLEVLVKPLKDEKTGIAQQYRDILTTAPGIEILDITTQIAERAAQLRAKYSLRTPDAIQLAAAIESGADYFLTNDLRLKAVAEVRIVTVSELE